MDTTTLFPVVPHPSTERAQTALTSVMDENGRNTFFFVSVVRLNPVHSSFSDGGLGYSVIYGGIVWPGGGKMVCEGVLWCV